MHLRLRFFPAALLIALVLLLLPLSGAGAEPLRQDEMRIGGDYEYLVVPEGGGHRWCEDSCRKDARCKSWTFVKTANQCRLKRLVGAAEANKCCISGVKSENADRGVRETCADYANDAVARQEANLAGRCGFHGDAWSGDYKLHFRACLDMSAVKRRNEMRDRELTLKRCADNSKKIDRNCQRFAETAEAIDATGRASDCRIEGAPWLGKYSKAYDWCRKNPGGPDEKGLGEIRDKLAQCFVRGGGPFIERCDAYAKDALRWHEAARKNECGFKGERWRSGYRDLYQWCLKVDTIDAKNENEARKREVERCLAQAGGAEEGKVACDHYARLASEQTRTNQKLGCGLKGRRWLADYDRQNAWCISTSKANRDLELKYREEELDKCFQRSGTPYNETCDDYAAQALSQNQLNLDSRCGFRSGDWSDSYIRHYKWCTTAKPGEAQRKQTQRKMALDTCRLGVRLPLGRR